MIDVVAAVVAATEGLGFHRPAILHPAALVDVVDIKIAVEAAAGPQEAVKPLDLVEQLADPLGPGAGERKPHRPAHPVGPQGDEVADLARLDPVEGFPADLALTAPQLAGH